MGPSFPVQTAASMVGGTLFTYPDNFRAQKALIAAKYSGADVKVSKDFKFGETNKSAEFLKKFPLGKVPAFEGSDGTLLTESNAIAYYVANEELRGGSDAATRAQVVQWMSMADSDILPAACTWVFPTMGIMQYNKNATERAKEDIKGVMKSLNDHLLAKTFLVGERISLADIAVCCTLLSLQAGDGPIFQGRLPERQQMVHNCGQPAQRQGCPWRGCSLLKGGAVRRQEVRRVLRQGGQEEGGEAEEGTAAEKGT